MQIPVCRSPSPRAGVFRLLDAGFTRIDSESEPSIEGGAG